MSVMTFALFIIIFLVLNVMTDIVSKVSKFKGIDFLLIASWIAGVKYGIGGGIVTALIMTIEHAFLNPHIARYIIFSMPSQILAAVLGNILGPAWFLVTLIAYNISTILIMIITEGAGARFVGFLIVNAIFNLFIYRIVMLLHVV